MEFVECRQAYGVVLVATQNPKGFARMRRETT